MQCASGTSVRRRQGEDSPNSKRRKVYEEPEKQEDNQNWEVDTDQDIQELHSRMNDTLAAIGSLKRYIPEVAPRIVLQHQMYDCHLMFLCLCMYV
jgi:hypothetical protein